MAIPENLSSGRNLVDAFRSAHNELYTKGLSGQEFKSQHKALYDKLKKDVVTLGYKKVEDFWSENKKYNDEATETDILTLTNLWA